MDAAVQRLTSQDVPRIVEVFCDAFWDYPNMIGVRRQRSRRGLGRELLESVQAMSRELSGSQGVSLTTENPLNVALYEHVGYEVVGAARVSPELETWAMFRRN